VNTHTSLKDRQGEPQWLQTKPLHTINASLVNEKDEKNQKLARRVFDFIPIGILKARTGMNFVQQVARGLIQGIGVFLRQGWLMTRLGGFIRERSKNMESSAWLNRKRTISTGFACVGTTTSETNGRRPSIPIFFL
jgi:hypothetical protein